MYGDLRSLFFRLLLGGDLGSLFDPIEGIKFIRLKKYTKAKERVNRTPLLHFQHHSSD